MIKKKKWLWTHDIHKIFKKIFSKRIVPDLVDSGIAYGSEDGENHRILGFLSSGLVQFAGGSCENAGDNH